MIVLRYITKELLNTWLAISGILLLIIVCERFIKYLEQAATGGIQAELLFAIMGYRIPGFLEMIMPLALFIGILLAHGRLYVDSEMTVLEACGMSQHQLLGYTMLPALLVALLVSLFSIWLTPMGTAKVEDILHRQDSMSGINRLAPGRFQVLNNGDRTAYVETVLDDKSFMNHVFIAQRSEKDGRSEMTLLLADQGHQHLDEKSGKRYLMLSNGYRYELAAGQPKSRIMKYETYGIQMKSHDARASKERAQPTSVLLSHDLNIASKAEWQWRISLPLLVPVVVLMALPLARVNPRQGRFMRLLPGILLYLLYLALLIAACGAVEDGNLSPSIGVWQVHGLFLAIALVMFYWRGLTQMLRGRGR
ncbi:MAG: LPS export ABC transporter permease LptF [Endozoicomonadaceae bacterium]|nr:LPS export ABC transporter permease LptF [Endozoicomonadaceae bacterium]